MNSDELCQVYRCLCDKTRLRILNLLSDGALCVCHLQEILAEPQVKISKHLAYLKTHDLVESERRANWMIYQITKKANPILEKNLKCLQDLISEDPIFKTDIKRLQTLDTSAICCPS